MIAILVSSIPVAIIGMFITAHALPAIKSIVRGWVWLYSAFAPEEERNGRRAEVDSHIFEFIDARRKVGDSAGDIAVGLFERWLKGLLSDIAWCAPFIPAFVVDKINVWSENLRHFRIPSAMIAGVAVLVPMNISLFTSQNNPVLWTGLLANGMALAMILLLWNIKKPMVKRILNAWMGIGMSAGVGVIIWMTFRFHFYDDMYFKILVLAMMAILPTIVVVDKSWRNRLFKGKWWLIVICWAAIIAGTITASWYVAHDVKPLLEMWLTIVIFAASLLIILGVLGFTAFGLCWLGIRGSARGLRLVASGIRRLC